jgi:hypothetical protein
MDDAIGHLREFDLSTFLSRFTRLVAFLGRGELGADHRASASVVKQPSVRAFGRLMAMEAIND